MTSQNSSASSVSVSSSSLPSSVPSSPATSRPSYKKSVSLPLPFVSLPSSAPSSPATNRPTYIPQLSFTKRRAPSFTAEAAVITSALDKIERERSFLRSQSSLTSSEVER